MKIFAIIVSVILLICPVTFAQNYSETIKFGWQQPQSDLPNLDKWNLYWSNNAADNYSFAVDVPYTGTAGPDFEASKSLTVTGLPGAEIQKYFFMTALGKNGKESGPSNVVSKIFKIPYSDVGVPQSLTIKVIVTTP